MAERKTVSAREVVADIRLGLTDDQLMRKYGLSAKGLGSLKTKLLTAGFVTQKELQPQAPPSKVGGASVDEKARDHPNRRGNGKALTTTGDLPNKKLNLRHIPSNPPPEKTPFSSMR